MVAPTRVIPPFPYADLLDKGPFNDWRDDLARDGYAVVKGAIPREKALGYRSRAFDWLESFARGFDRNDPKTFSQPYLPAYQRGGMYFSHGIHQEQWVWDIRTEPGIKNAFETLWGTKELVVSMDGAAIMLPGGPPLAPDLRQWKHIDLSPHREGFFVAQGLVNLNENGPDDGGLLVMKGSSKLLKEYFDEVGRPPLRDGKIDWHSFEEEEMKWFFDRGCEWLKVCAEPGDLILWDSATIHQNCPPTGDRDRMVTYVCMGPASLMTEEDKEVRQQTFKEGYGTFAFEAQLTPGPRISQSHAPFRGTFAVIAHPVRDDTGKVDPDADARKNPRKETEEVKRLAGVLAY
ncbi:hypothetical protein JCM11641_005058 [Rhodosporidiobolus odoratus]